MRVYFTHSTWKYLHARAYVLLWTIILFVHPVTATRTLYEQKLSTRHHFSMAKNSSMGSFTFWMSLQISEEVGPCRCCIFSHCVSCSSVCIIRPTTLAAAAKRRPYIRAHVCAFLFWVFCCYVYLQYVVLLPSFQSKSTICCSPVFITTFHAFFVRLLDSCQSIVMKSVPFTVGGVGHFASIVVV